MLLAKATGVAQDPGSLSEAGQHCFDSWCFTELGNQVQLLPIPLALVPPALQPSHVLFLSASCDQNRVGQDSYVLMASSQVEMEEWVKFLRRVAGTPSGGKNGHCTTISEQASWEEEEAGSRHHLSLCSVQGRGQRPLKPLA